MELIQNFILESLSWIWLPQISLTDILEIIILSVLIYYIFVWVKETRAWMLLKGILALVLFGVVAYVLRLSTILWIVSKIINVAFIAVVVVFQPKFGGRLRSLDRKICLRRCFRLTTRMYRSASVIRRFMKLCVPASR